MTLANTVNRSNTTPAAPGGAVNVTWQDDGGSPIVNVSAYVPVAGITGTFTPEAVSFSGTSGTLAHTPLSGSFFALFRNGVLMTTTGSVAIQTYSITGAAITLSVAAGTGDNFYALYYH